ncbi:putative B3 domain-containing protein [Acorus calamus]|uniref:B3 domain-containing protein n=1 Tax=Acorus calamus TaxID=4465 RepID=A0AAV9BZ38_ACOCL|nr:putative B3 domain-containing protein [Acorus calamus]
MVSPAFVRRPHFFRVFLPGITSERLGIPRAFWKHIEGLSAGTVSLVGPSRNTWHVNLVKNGNDVFFENGWQEFAKDHSLQTGEFLVFRFDENSHFNVSVYDKTACEKEEAFYADQSCEGSSVMEDHENMKKVMETDINLPSIGDCKAPSCSSKRKRGEKIQPVVEQPVTRYQACLKRRASCEESEVMLKKQATMPSKENASPRCFKASIKPSNLTLNYMNIPSEFIKSQGLKETEQLYLRNPIGALWRVEISHKHEPVLRSYFSRGWLKFANGCTKEGASDDKTKSNKWTTKNPQLRNDMETDGVYQQDGISFFVATIKPANVAYSYMYIPYKFLALNGFRRKREIMVRDHGGREWQLKISGSGNNWRFRGGWLNLAGDNGLEVGDVCIFEFNPKGDHNIMDLRIVKMKSKPNLCEKDTSPSVQKNSEEHRTEYKIKKQHPSGTPFPSSIGESRLKESANVTEPTKTTNQEKLEGDQLEEEGRYSMANVLALLNDTPRILKNSPEYFHAISKFTNEAHRQAFVFLADQETRSLWIKHDYGSTHNM